MSSNFVPSANDVPETSTSCWKSVWIIACPVLNNTSLLGSISAGNHALNHWGVLVTSLDKDTLDLVFDKSYPSDFLDLGIVFQLRRDQKQNNLDCETLTSYTLWPDMVSTYIGTTSKSYDEIKEEGQRIIQNSPTYHLINNNCQNFATSLVEFLCPHSGSRYPETIQDKLRSASPGRLSSSASSNTRSRTTTSQNTGNSKRDSMTSDDCISDSDDSKDDISQGKPMEDFQPASLPITEEVLEDVNHSLDQAEKHLVKAATQLQETYQPNGLTTEVLGHRQRLYSEGMMYGKTVYPLTLELVRKIKSTLENYLDLDFDDFVECIDVISKECLSHAKAAKKAQIAHTYALANLKVIRQDMEVSKNDLESYQQSQIKKADKRRVQSQVAKVGGTISYGGATAALALVPIDFGATAATLVLTGISSQVIGAQRKRKMEGSLMKREKTLKNVDVLQSLISSLDKLAKAVNTLACFVTLLRSELGELSQIGKVGELHKLHWKKMAGKVNRLLESCNRLIAVEPTISSNLLVIKDSLDYGFEEDWKKGLEREFDKDTHLEIAM